MVVDVEVVKVREGRAAEGAGGIKIGGGAGRPEWSDEAEQQRRGVGDDDSGALDASVEKIRASLLVAADGVRSAVQRIRLPNKKLNYLGGE